MLPNIEIIKVLSEAYSPCQSFGKCKEAQWLPEEGHIPRGFLGATGLVNEVEAIFVFAEPGHPMMNEHGSYPESLDPEGYMELTTDFAFKYFDKLGKKRIDMRRDQPKFWNQLVKQAQPTFQKIKLYSADIKDLRPESF